MYAKFSPSKILPTPPTAKYEQLLLGERAGLSSQPRILNQIHIIMINQ